MSAQVRSAARTENRLVKIPGTGSVLVSITRSPTDVDKETEPRPGGGSVCPLATVTVVATPPTPDNPSMVRFRRTTPEALYSWMSALVRGSQVAGGVSPLWRAAAACERVRRMCPGELVGLSGADSGACRSRLGIADLQKVAVAECLQSFNSVRGQMEKLGTT